MRPIDKHKILRQFYIDKYKGEDPEDPELEEKVHRAVKKFDSMPVVDVLNEFEIRFLEEREGNTVGGKKSRRRTSKKSHRKSSKKQRKSRRVRKSRRGRR